MSSAPHSLLDLPDIAFRDAWTSLSIEERSAIGALGFERFNKLTRHVDESVRRLERVHDKREAAALNFDRGEPGVPKSKAKERTSSESSSPRPLWPDALDLEALAEREPLAPKFIIPDWLATGYAAGLWGHGGAGKSSLGLMLAVCLAAGVPFLGLPVVRSRVLFLSCEDRESVLHWRLARICSHLGVDLAALRGWLQVVDLVGAECVLWTSDRGSGSLTAGYAALTERMREADVLIGDGITDTYAGSELDRAEIKRFVSCLVGLISPDRGAVLLLGHVNRSTAAGAPTTEGYSGSTGWHNAVRSRWYLYPEARSGDTDEPADRTGNVVLELQKSNYGRTDQAIRLAWDQDAHLFLPIEEGSGFAHFDAAQREREEQEAILRAITACSAAGRVPAAVSGPRTAYHVLSVAEGFPDSLRGGRGAKRRFWRHVEVLRQRGAIVEGEHKGADRHRTAVLLPVAGYAGNVK